MMQITKTEETDFEEFKKEHIQLVNDDWTTPLSTTRSDTIIITLSLCTILTEIKGIRVAFFSFS